MKQLEITWEKPKPIITAARGKGRPFLVNSANATFRWLEPTPDDAITRAEGFARYRKSTTTVYEELEDRTTQRIAAFDPTGRRFI